MFGIDFDDHPCLAGTILDIGEGAGRGGLQATIGRDDRQIRRVSFRDVYGWALEKRQIRFVGLCIGGVVPRFCEVNRVEELLFFHVR